LKSVIAGTDGPVINRFASGVLAASVHARIRTLVLDASLAGRAVRMQNAFWPAGWRRANGSRLA